MSQKRVCIIGSGNFGSAIARMVGENTANNPDLFENVVKLWVYEEKIGDRNLTDIINSDHENVKYLPGHKLPDNIIATPDLMEATAGADILIVVVPHQFVNQTLTPLKGTLKSEAVGVSLIKGMILLRLHEKYVSGIVENQFYWNISG